MIRLTVGYSLSWLTYRGLTLPLTAHAIKPVVVMLSGAKHLAFSATYEDEILRLRLRMTLRHSLYGGRKLSANTGSPTHCCVKRFVSTKIRPIQKPAGRKIIPRCRPLVFRRRPRVLFFVHKCLPDSRPRTHIHPHWAQDVERAQLLLTANSEFLPLIEPTKAEC